VRRVLVRAGYTTLVATSAEEALALVETRPGEVHLLLTDVLLPGKDGPALATALRERRPWLPVLYMSGYAEGVLARGGQAIDNAPLLSKPTPPSLLLSKVREMLVGVPRDVLPIDR
jgi:CheY-like chemotaxis protein